MQIDSISECEDEIRKTEKEIAEIKLRLWQIQEADNKRREWRQKHSTLKKVVYGFCFAAFAVIFLFGFDAPIYLVLIGVFIVIFVVDFIEKKSTTGQDSIERRNLNDRLKSRREELFKLRSLAAHFGLPEPYKKIDLRLSTQLLRHLEKGIKQKEALIIKKANEAHLLTWGSLDIFLSVYDRAIVLFQKQMGYHSIEQAIEDFFLTASKYPYYFCSHVFTSMQEQDHFGERSFQPETDFGLEPPKARYDIKDFAGVCFALVIGLKKYPEVLKVVDKFRYDNRFQYKLLKQMLIWIKNQSKGDLTMVVNSVKSEREEEIREDEKASRWVREKQIKEQAETKICTFCGGSGQRVMPAFGSPSGREWMTCPRCGGTGRL